MLKYIFLPIIIGVANSLNAPRDLVDKAEAELIELKNIVQEETIVAYKILSDTASDFEISGNNIYEDGIIFVQEEDRTIKTSLNSIKGLAEAAKVNISICIDIREEILGRLPARFDKEIKDCVNMQIVDVKSIINDANRRVSLNLVKVAELEDDLTNCNGNLFCIQLLLIDIELNKVRIPVNIKTELNTVQEEIDNRKITVQGCSTDNNSVYNAIAYDLLNDIMTCVVRLWN